MTVDDESSAVEPDSELQRLSALPLDERAAALAETVRRLEGEHDAQRLIAEQRILVDGAPALQPSSLVAGSSRVDVLDPPRTYVTRGGVKLAGALDDFALDPRGLRCLDAGAGAGGFTDCLLQRGAGEVVAVDVGYGDFDWSLRQDPRVRLFERANIRVVDPALLGEPFDLAVGDLSFISLVAV